MNKHICKGNNAIKDALIQLGNTKVRTLIIVDNDNKVIGSLTDSDIRHALLSGVDTKESVCLIMNKNCVKYTVNNDDEFIPDEKRRLFLKKSNLNVVPVVNKDNLLLDLIIKNKSIYSKTPVVIMCGGLGTRMGYLTKECPKPMLKVYGKPMLEIIIRQLSAERFKKIYLAINYLGEQIESYFGDGSNFGVEIKYIKEHKRMGTGGALSLIEDSIKSPILVMNGDIITDFDLRNLLDFHMQSKSFATMAISEHTIQNPFGVVKFDGANFLDIDEKPIYKSYINSGVYAIEPGFLSMVPKDTFIDMPTLLSMAKEKSKKVLVYPIIESWVDVGRIADYERLNA